MPVYLFTFHAYRSWMPDHPRGYTKRGEGYQPTDLVMATNYERRAHHQPLVFDATFQRIIVEQVREACGFLKCRMHGCVTEKTHVHCLISWSNDRTWESVRSSLKTSLTKRLKKCCDGAALSRGGSPKHVKDRDHFEYLMNVYLPDHKGVGWLEDRGWVNLRVK